MKIEGYESQETLHQGNKYFVCRAKKAGSEKTYVVKALEKKSVYHVKHFPYLQSEYELLSLVHSDFVVKPVEWIENNDHCAIVLEDINGTDFANALGNKTLPVREFMAYARSITRGLAAVHKTGIIHQDICPANIIWDIPASRIQLIDFDISSKFSIKMSYVNNLEKLKGTLLYVSPEQTGRMNRTVDQRTDLYSLGAVFYQLLTGKPPFTYSDPMELIHAILARDPEPPCHLNENIPGPLSDIILKLLSKNAEDRYQSVEGLQHDLTLLDRMLSVPGEPATLVLGQKDFSGVLQLPEKLFGRKTEIEKLLEAYGRASRGAKEMILVAGYSGTGKTALVNEIHRPITRDRGYFISGKFDQLHRTVPYSAIIHALDHFCQLVLAEKSEVLADVRTKILEAVGSLGRILTDLIPGLELIIGKQPAVPKIYGEEEEKRFNYLFQRFFRTISSKDSPLVIFIDDLQWADLASLKLLKIIMEDKLNNYVLLIGAYRDNEVSATHPMVTTVEEIKQSHDGEMTTIPVKNLLVEDVLELTAAALNAPTPEHVWDLAKLVHQKTRGNAFFTIQFLENLYKEKLLRFDFERSEWIYEIAGIEQQNITDNVVDLLVRRLRTLPEKSQEYLKLASCIGNTFDLDTLMVIAQISDIEHETFLENALIERLIYPLEEGRYKFVHDRVQQAAYSLTADQDKKSLHVEIGRLLLKQYEKSEGRREQEGIEQKVFAIANQFNIGIELIREIKEKLKLAKINLTAGQNARISGAYAFALDYIKNALGLLPEDCWQNHYEQALAVSNEAVQVSYLCGNFEEMEGYIKTIVANCGSTSDARLAYEFRMNSYISQNLPQKGLDTLIDVFEKLGVAMPDASRVEAQTGEMMQKIHQMILDKGGDHLRNLPVMDDPEKQLALRFFVSGMSAMVYAGPHLLPLITCKMMELSLAYGFTPDTPFVFVTYGLVKSTFGDTAGAYEIGEITLDMLERVRSDDTNAPKIKYMLTTYLLGWKLHYRELAKFHKENRHNAINVGDHEYAGYCLTNECHFLNRTDTVLSEQHRVLLENNEVIGQIEQVISLMFHQIEIEAMATLMGERGNPAVFDYEREEGWPEGIANINIFAIANRKIYLGYLFEEYTHMAEYLNDAEASWPYIQVPLVFWKVDCHFYFPLAYAQLYTRTGDKTLKKNYLEKIQDCIAVMKEWADFGPINFLHKYYILQAELCRITGEPDQAAKYYDLAVEKAFENHYLNEAAIANELAAKSYIETGREKLAGFYFKEAKKCYEICGLATKVRHLEETYPKYLGQSIPGASFAGETMSGLTGESTGAFLDIRSILKASQALSGEVQIEPLLEKMMHILIENAGARRGLFIENKEGAFLVQAEGTVDGVSDVVAATPLAGDRAPLSLIQYVARSKQQVVSDNLSKDTNHAKDKYIRAKTPLSVVCFPVLRKRGSLFILYLENNLVEGAFTPARLEMLNMLSGQIAISIENAELYENLEEKVKERTIALEKSHEELKKSHKKITDNVNYASRIQKAVLPAQGKIKALFPRHFILYRPCSVVSGDFYWVKEIGDHIVVAAADCTGHGVSGALVSMQGMAFLNDIVPALAANGNLSAGNILDVLREKTKTAFKESGDIWNQREGMDISLYIVNPEKTRIQYAGAYNPLYILRGNSLIEIKADRMPVGSFLKERPFNTHEISIEKEDVLYLFTDGFTDQIDKTSGKKFNKTRFKKLLSEIHQEPMDVQKNLLANRFDQWREGFPQVDDILIFGIRI